MKKSSRNALVALIAVFFFFVSTSVSSSLIKVYAAPKSEKAIAAQTLKGEKGQQIAETHRSVVATFVKNLLSVADREGGIGEQVRVIAQQQNDSKTKILEEIDTVEKRSKIKTFFLGTDYKNLGALRSEMVKTRNRIEQLKRLVEKTTVEEDKTILQDQIKALELEQTKINDFITKNESEFSLFGWFVKLFNK